MKNNIMRRSLVLVLVLTLVMSLGATGTMAATKKTVKKCGFQTETKKAKKKAVKVKKGTTQLTYAKGKGYVKFKVPKTKKYTFTMSGVKSLGSTPAYSGYWYVMRTYGTKGKYISMEKVKTQGGKTSSMWMAEKGYESKSGEKKYQNLLSRYAKIKLKKGETVYLYFYAGDQKTQATLKIK